MMESANKSEEIQNAFFFCSHRLKVCINLILYLLKLRLNYIYNIFRFLLSNDDY
jgi:hypothetical protein